MEKILEHYAAIYDDIYGDRRDKFMKEHHFVIKYLATKLIQTKEGVPMLNIIRYFEEQCSKKFKNLEDEFMKNPSKLAEYVYQRRYTCFISIHAPARGATLVLRNQLLRVPDFNPRSHKGSD